MTGTYETVPLETILVDPNQTGSKTTVNDGNKQLADCLAGDLSTSLTAESTPYALPYSAVEGAAKTGLHNMVYDFTGTITPPYVVEHPAVKHLFIAENSTDNEFTLKVTGQTGVLLGVGARRILYCNGTDVIDMETSPLTSFVIAVSDETTNITTGTAKVTFRVPYGLALTDIRINLNTVSSSGLPTVDVNLTGTGTILSTKLTIDVSELTSVTAATPYVLSTTTLADDAELTVDIDVAGTGAKGLKLALIGYRV